MTLRSSNDNINRKHAKSNHAEVKISKEARKQNKHKCKHWKETSSSSSMRIPPTLFSSDQKMLLLNLSRLEPENKMLNVAFEKPNLPVLQIVIKHHAIAVNYRTSQFANRSSRYGDTVSSYVTKLFEKVANGSALHWSKKKYNLYHPLSSKTQACVWNKQVLQRSSYVDITLFRIRTP